MGPDSSPGRTSSAAELSHPRFRAYGAGLPTQHIVVAYKSCFRFAGSPFLRVFVGKATNSEPAQGALCKRRDST
jgi:hypothetical protein